MTTLVGIVAQENGEGVVLASDLSRTSISWIAQGDVAYREQTKSEGQKIYVDDKRETALCMSGIFDQDYVDFLSAILRGRIEVKKAVEQGFFPELEKLNLARWGGRVPNNDQMNALLLATRFDDKPRLYTCYPLGKIEERYWTSIGSGSKYALNHIAKQERLIPQYLTLEGAVDLAQLSLEEASQDIYTGGSDIVVARPKDMLEFGSNIKTEIDLAKQRANEKIKSKLRE